MTHVVRVKVGKRGHCLNEKRGVEGKCFISRGSVKILESGVLGVCCALSLSECVRFFYIYRDYYSVSSSPALMA